MSMKMTSPSELELEAYILGELDEARRAKMGKARRDDPRVAQRLAEIERDNAETLGRYPPEEMARRIEARLEASSNSAGRLRPLPRPAPGVRGRLLALAGIAALLVAGVLAYSLRGGLPGAADGGELTRAKGGAPHLILFRKTAAGAERLSDGAAAAQHDLLQIAYQNRDEGFGAVFSIDGRGVVTFQAPQGYAGGDATPAPRLQRGESVPLPSAYELDDAPRFERFFFVVSKNGFDLATVARAARALASKGEAARTQGLQLPSGFAWSSFTLQKAR